MVAHMAKEEGITVRVNSLAFIYDCLNAVSDEKTAPHAKIFTLPLAFLLGQLSCCCPETCNQRCACPSELLLICGIVGVKPNNCTFHYAFDLFCQVNRISEYPEFGLLEAMNWRVVRGYLEEREVVWVGDYACRNRPHVHPPTRPRHVTIEEHEF